MAAPNHNNALYYIYDMVRLRLPFLEDNNTNKQTISNWTLETMADLEVCFNIRNATVPMNINNVGNEQYYSVIQRSIIADIVAANIILATVVGLAGSVADGGVDPGLFMSKVKAGSVEVEYGQLKFKDATGFKDSAANMINRYQKSAIRKAALQGCIIDFSDPTAIAVTNMYQMDVTPFRVYVDSCGLSWSPPERGGYFDSSKQPYPMLAPPTNFAVTDLGGGSYRFSWTKPKDAVSSVLRISTSADFTTGVSNVLTDSNAHVASLPTGTYYTQVKAIASGFIDSQWVSYVDEIVVGGGGSGTTAMIYYGAKPTSALLTEAQILNAPDSLTVTTGDDIEIDYRDIADASYLWFAEPATEPIKRLRFASDLDQDENGDDGLFSDGVIIGDFRFYQSNYPTYNTQYTQIFQVGDAPELAIYFGATDVALNMTEDDITGSADTMPVVEGEDVTIDFRGITSDKYLWFAEPATEPAKTLRYASDLDQDQIGDSGLFSIVGIVGEYRLYRSNYATSNTQFVQVFKIS